MKHALIALALMVPGFASAQEAGQPTLVYELFTSQGCSSCPPANAEIDRLSREEGVLALSYGVTYWDYLGWEDTFAQPEFTKRQRSYVRALEARNAYTPQIVMNGRRHAPTARKLKAYETVAHDVVLESTGSRVEAKMRNDRPGEAVLVTFTPGRQDVPVKAGENGGRTVSVTNVVSSVRRVDLPYRFTPREGLAYALLQHGRDTEVTSAAVWMPSADE